MTEIEQSPKEPLYTRQHVIEAFKPLIARGYTSPDDLPLFDPEVIKANMIHTDWVQQQESIVERKGSLRAELEFDLDGATVLVDAGFTDPRYLDEVANDWLIQDLEAAQQAGLIETSEWIAGRIFEINSKIPN